MAYRNLPVRRIRRGSEADATSEITQVRPRLGALGVPRLAMSWDAVRGLPLDPRLAYVLSRIDGQSSVDTLADVTGFPLEALLGHLTHLVELGAVELLPPR